jgi:hypothetical protein
MWFIRVSNPSYTKLDRINEGSQYMIWINRNCRSIEQLLLVKMKLFKLQVWQFISSTIVGSYGCVIRHIGALELSRQDTPAPTQVYPCLWPLSILLIGNH